MGKIIDTKKVKSGTKGPKSGTKGPKSGTELVEQETVKPENETVKPENETVKPENETVKPVAPIKTKVNKLLLINILVLLSFVIAIFSLVLKQEHKNELKPPQNQTQEKIIDLSDKIEMIGNQLIYKTNKDFIKKDKKYSLFYQVFYKLENIEFAMSFNWFLGNNLLSNNYYSSQYLWNSNLKNNYTITCGYGSSYFLDQDILVFYFSLSAKKGINLPNNDFSILENNENNLLIVKEHAF